MQELSLNILDIAQNSIRAGASLITIGVEEQPACDRLMILVEDNGCGMTPEQVAQVTDPFFTTRTTRKVGLGLPFLKMSAEMTGGSLSIASEVGKGTTVRAEFGRSHVDRMPLGDIAQTVAALVQCNPDRDFVYTYVYQDQQFSADTREFRAILEDVPLSSPEVVGFITDYIRENTREILNMDGGSTEDEKLS